MKVRELYNWGSDKLRKADILEFEEDAKILLMDALNLDFSKYVLAFNEDVSSKDEDKFKEYIFLRCKEIPVQYILNKQNFMGFDFYVNSDVLIPRYDTEVLVSFLVEYIGDDKLKVLDLCCGSGAIGISIDKICKYAKVCASDISELALEVAKKNNLAIGSDVTFIKSDLFNSIEVGNFDIIVSNPPYIKSRDIEDLSPTVKNYEPIIALDGGIDGLDFYRDIISKAPDYLNSKGMLVLEIGFDQGQELLDIFEKDGRYEEATLIRDFANLNRVIYTKLK